MVTWIARTSGDIVRNTSLTFADLANATDEQIIVLAASAAREHRSIDGGTSAPKTPSGYRKEGFKTEEELKAHYLQLGRMLGFPPEQAELEFQACKERGAKFVPGKK